MGVMIAIIMILAWVAGVIVHGIVYSDGYLSALGDKQYPRWRHIVVTAGCLVPVWQWYIFYRKIHDNKNLPAFPTYKWAKEWLKEEF
jgi:Na+-driven multidrug efflux pump